MSYFAQASIIRNKFIFEQMINYVKEFHYKVITVDNKITLQSILKELYIAQKNAVTDSYEKQCYTDTVNEMCQYVCSKYNVSKTKIYQTWLNLVFEGNIELAPFDTNIIKYLKEFFFGNVQTYQVIFEHNDRNTRKGRYYYVINLEFDNQDNIKGFLSIQDLKKDNYLSHEKGLLFINNSCISDGGFIAFNVSDETLAGLAQYAYYEFNNCGFTGGCELYPQLSLINNKQQLKDYVNDYIAISQYNKRFLDLLLPK
jgi:hypothetical protein